MSGEIKKYSYDDYVRLCVEGNMSATRQAAAEALYLLGKFDGIAECAAISTRAPVPVLEKQVKP
jgi:hypothetical protein